MAAGEGDAVIGLDEAVRIFQKLVPPEGFNARQGATTAMVYTPWIVAWLMIYQRLNGAATLADAVTELAGMDGDLVPENKRTREKTVSANTGAYAGARGRLKAEAAEDAADRVSDALMARAEPATAAGGRRAFLVDGSTLALAPVDCFRALVRRAESAGPGVWRLAWSPSPWDRKHNPGLPADAVLSVRLHEVRICETLTLWLVTSLDDAGTVLATMYHGRQDVETDLRDLKQTLRLEVLRSRSPAMIRKELAAATVAYNLVVLTRKLAAARAKVKPRSLSFARVCSLVKVLLRQQPSDLEPARTQERIEQVLRMAAQCKIPNRPGRSDPREVFWKPTKYPRRQQNQVTKPKK